MGWSESHISLKCQRQMTFTAAAPHLQMFIKLLIFADFLLTVVLYVCPPRYALYAGSNFRKNNNMSIESRKTNTLTFLNFVCKLVTCLN